jgi:hypothetical protein
MEELLATLTGLALPTIAQYQRFDDEQSRKIRENRLDVRDLQAAFSALNTNGQAIRNRLRSSTIGTWGSLSVPKFSRLRLRSPRCRFP